MPNSRWRDQADRSKQDRSADTPTSIKHGMTSKNATPKGTKFQFSRYQLLKTSGQAGARMKIDKRQLCERRMEQYGEII